MEYCFFKKDSTLKFCNIISEIFWSSNFFISQFAPKANYSPITGENLTHQTLITNHLLKQVAKVSEWKPGNEIGRGDPVERLVEFCQQSAALQC